MLGVSERSVTRKAREMGLEKDKGFVASLSREHLLLANARSKELGYPGGFTKGMKFRGNQYTGRISQVLLNLHVTLAVNRKTETVHDLHTDLQTFEFLEYIAHNIEVLRGG